MKTKKQIMEEIKKLEKECEKVKGTMLEHPINLRIVALNWVLENERTGKEYINAKKDY